MVIFDKLQPPFIITEDTPSKATELVFRRKCHLLKTLDAVWSGPTGGTTRYIHGLEGQLISSPTILYVIKPITPQFIVYRLDERRTLCLTENGADQEVGVPVSPHRMETVIFGGTYTKPAAIYVGKE